MGSINQRNGKLLADFRYMNQRCREQTQLSDTSANRKRLTRLLKTIEAEILLGTFEYAKYFPSLEIEISESATVPSSDNLFGSRSSVASLSKSS